MQIGWRGPAWIRGWPVCLAAVLFFLACRSPLPVFEDARYLQRPFGELIREAPFVVIGQIEATWPSGQRGLIPRRKGLPPAPGQRVSFSLMIQSSMRGGLSTGQTIRVYSYESSLGVIGAAEGVCGPRGSRGIYFLTAGAGHYRTAVDGYKMWIPLEPQSDLQGVSSDIPMSIWNLLVRPYSSGVLGARELDWTMVGEYTGWRLGRARMIELLQDEAERSQTFQTRVSACRYLNHVHRGCGGEACLTELLDDRTQKLAAGDRAALQRELDGLGAANAMLRKTLADGVEADLKRLAWASDTSATKTFLTLLTRHPDRDLAALAAKRLTQLVTVQAGTTSK